MQQSKMASGPVLSVYNKVPFATSKTYIQLSLLWSVQAIIEPSSEIATEDTPLAPWPNLTLCTFWHVEASQTKIAGDLPTWPVTHRLLP